MAILRKSNQGKDNLGIILTDSQDGCCPDSPVCRYMVLLSEFLGADYMVIKQNGVNVQLDFELTAGNAEELVEEITKAMQRPIGYSNADGSIQGGGGAIVTGQIRYMTIDGGIFNEFAAILIDTDIEIVEIENAILEVEGALLHSCTKTSVCRYRFFLPLGAVNPVLIIGDQSVEVTGTWSAQTASNLQDNFNNDITNVGVLHQFGWLGSIVTKDSEGYTIDIYIKNHPSMTFNGDVPVLLGCRESYHMPEAEGLLLDFFEGGSMDD